MRSTTIGIRGIAATELMAVVAVTLIMMTLAVSAYRTYVGRSEASRILIAVASIQVLVADAFKRTGSPPATAHDVPGLAHALPRDRLIRSVTIKHGRIEIGFSHDATAGLRDRALQLTPFETTDGQIVWLCGDGPADAGLYPLGFAAGTNHETEKRTTVDPRYLPTTCR